MFSVPLSEYVRRQRFPSILDQEGSLLEAQLSTSNAVNIPVVSREDLRGFWLTWLLYFPVLGIPIRFAPRGKIPEHVLYHT